jgi:hypothetical protein
MAILGTGRRGVNENGATMDAAAPKSRILRISVALDPLVRKGCAAGAPTGFLSTRHFWIFGWPARIPSEAFATPIYKGASLSGFESPQGWLAMASTRILLHSRAVGSAAERIIDEIEQLQEMFEAPDIRPLSASDLRAANRRHDEMLANRPWFRLWQSYGVCCRTESPTLRLPGTGN